MCLHLPVAICSALDAQHLIAATILLPLLQLLVIALHQLPSLVLPL